MRNGTLCRTKEAMKLLPLFLLSVSLSAYAAPKDAKIIAIVTKAVADSMKDPESARFRNMHITRGNVCGEVNAKNGMGGYVGFARFFVPPSGLVRMDDGGGLFLTDWSEGCSSAKPKEPAPYYEKSWDDMK